MIMDNLITNQINARNIRFMPVTLLTQYHPDVIDRPLRADKIHFMARMVDGTHVPGKLFADVQILMNHFCSEEIFLSNNPSDTYK